jgi:hypothetical protein
MNLIEIPHAVTYLLIAYHSFSCFLRAYRVTYSRAHSTADRRYMNEFGRLPFVLFLEPAPPFAPFCFPAGII